MYKYTAKKTRKKTLPPARAKISVLFHSAGMNKSIIDIIGTIK